MKKKYVLFYYDNDFYRFAYDRIQLAYSLLITSFVIIAVCSWLLILEAENFSILELRVWLYASLIFFAGHFLIMLIYLLRSNGRYVEMDKNFVYVTGYGYYPWQAIKKIEIGFNKGNAFIWLCINNTEYIRRSRGVLLFQVMVRVSGRVTIIGSPEHIQQIYKAFQDVYGQWLQDFADYNKQ